MGFLKDVKNSALPSILFEIWHEDDMNDEMIPILFYVDYYYKISKN